ncbi:MAG: glycerol kinase [Calditrichaeota bacterium]|nr:MAG: glycerol kinase [Calditrichota bacterium]
MLKKAVLAIDQGTTGTTVLIVENSGEIRCRAYSEFRQFYPKPGWVEHDAEEIWSVTKKLIIQAVKKAKLKPHDIAAIGITNQRETTVIWDRRSGKPIHNAIVWQCRRTSDFCSELQSHNLTPLFHAKTGLVIDAYFSATKIKWLLDHVPGARSRAQAGELCFGTIDSWMLWKLTDGAVHATDYTNASRTLVYNIHSKTWDKELLDILDIPSAILPIVDTSSGIFGYTSPLGPLKMEIPIAGIAGDQQAAMYGQNCWEAGLVKNTYGTGCFMMMNTGAKAIHSTNRLLTTLACDALGRPCFALEGSIFIAGALIQWLRDELGLIRTAAETEALAQSVADTHGVYIVPAFVGLGAPHWDMNARGIISGLTRGSNKAHIARAALEAIAYQSHDVLKAMANDSGLSITEVHVDGGASANDFLMQFQADILNVKINRPHNIDTTALGAAFLAGLAVGFWKDQSELSRVRRIDRVFTPEMDERQRMDLLAGWEHTVRQCKLG